MGEVICSIACIIVGVLTSIWYMHYTGIVFKDNKIRIIILLSANLIVMTLTAIMLGESSIIINGTWILLIELMCIIAYKDYQSYEIPNKAIISGVLLSVIYLIVCIVDGYRINMDDISALLIRLLITFIVGVVIVIVGKESIGMGDVKLMLMLGLFYNGWDMIGIMYIALIISVVVYILIITFNKKRKKNYIAFAPCVLIAMVIHMIV